MDGSSSDGCCVIDVSIEVVVGNFGCCLGSPGQSLETAERRCAPNLLPTERFSTLDHRLSQIISIIPTVLLLSLSTNNWYRDGSRQHQGTQGKTDIRRKEEEGDHAKGKKGYRSQEYAKGHRAISPQGAPASHALFIQRETDCPSNYPARSTTRSRSKWSKLPVVAS